MHEIEEWITDAASSLGVACRRESREVGRDLVRQARTIYVENNPRVWWLALKLPCKHYSSEEIGLTDVLPSREGKCWLIPETDAEDLPVYEIDSESVELIIEECPYFEYYVLARELSWLVIETDHNVFFVCERNLI